MVRPEGGTLCVEGTGPSKGGAGAVSKGAPTHSLSVCAVPRCGMAYGEVYLHVWDCLRIESRLKAKHWPFSSIYYLDFWATPNSAQRLLLAPHSGTTPGSAW